MDFLKKIDNEEDKDETKNLKQSVKKLAVKEQKIDDQ